VRKRVAQLTNAVLRPLGAQLVPYEPRPKPWDADFLRWIREAEASGKDPNDVGDVAWDDDPLKHALEAHYLPHIHPDSVVLELGPGTGRATRHVISHCREMILADYSQLVCDWLSKYLQNKGRFKILLIDGPSLAAIEDQRVDMAFANGVFEHIDMDDLFYFLEEFYRVLKPGSVLSFNFDNVMTEEGVSWYREYRRGPGTKCLFKFYHPEAVRNLGEQAGFRLLKLSTSQSRFAFIELQKPVSQANSRREQTG
jgi:ubiquinone/menaquinone biosynthesis C-methylase UbiE